MCFKGNKAHTIKDSCFSNNSNWNFNITYENFVFFLLGGCLKSNIVTRIYSLAFSPPGVLMFNCHYFQLSAVVPRTYLFSESNIFSTFKEKIQEKFRKCRCPKNLLGLLLLRTEKQLGLFSSASLKNEGRQQHLWL